MPGLRRIGHMGADLIAPGNTVASFDAAIEAGVDMLEFDVLPERLDGTGELYLAHSYEDLAARRDTVMTLAEGLDHLCGTGYELDLDMKIPGYEERVVEALRARGYERRVIVSSMYLASLKTVRAMAPEIKLGLAVPRMHRNPFDRKLLLVPAFVGMHVLRRVLPRRLPPLVADGLVDALMVNHLLTTRRLVDAVLEAGGEIYVWTVDVGERIERLQDWGVTGVITNDPRLFHPLITQVAAE